MSFEEMENIEEVYFNQEVHAIKWQFRHAKAWKCCGGEHCVGNRKVAGRKGLVHNNKKSKLTK